MTWIRLLLCASTMLGLAVPALADISQYNLSLQDKTTVAYNGAVTHPDAANVDKAFQINEKSVTQIADGIYRIAGWGISNSVAVEGPDGWVIVDAGDNLEAAQEQRQMLEGRVGKIKVAAVVYTHSHYIWGARAWQDIGTQFYAHEKLEENMRADQGVGPLHGAFMARAVAQFGLLHPPQGPDAFPNHLGFGLGKLTNTKAFVSPTVTFEDEVIEQHTIGGLAVEVLPSKTDTEESVAYYFPEKKLLVSNALNFDIIFNLYTLRGSWYRNPMDFVEAADMALARDIEYNVDIHGAAQIGKEQVIAGLQQGRDQMQLIHDQTYRAIGQGMDAQAAAEWVYMPTALRASKETYGQVESHVKQVYSGRIGWMGWDVYDINPLPKASSNGRIIEAMGGFDTVLAAAQAANAKHTLEDWQWALYLTSELLEADANHAEAKAVRAEAARALGQRTASANARGWYITEALLHEDKLALGGHTISHLQQLSQTLGAVTPATLAASPLSDNVEYLRYLVDSRIAEGKQAAFNARFSEEGLEYAIELRNGIIAITDLPNDGPTINLSKADWDQLIAGEKSFASLHPSLKSIDQVIHRQAYSP